MTQPTNKTVTQPARRMIDTRAKFNITTGGKKRNKAGEVTIIK